MECQDGGDKNEKHLLQQPLVRQNSLYGLTLNEVENELGERGKPVSSMNLDELLKIVYTVEENHSTKAGLSLTSSLCMKTVDEVWRDIQESKENKFEERQLRLGDIKLADFLVRAGVVVEASSTVVNPQQPQYQIPQQGLMGIYMTGQNIAQSLHTRATATSLDKTFERRQKRMIKNRESAARSRARKQAYTIELEHKISRLEEENQKLRRQKEIENILLSVPPQKPRYQIRRTTSASF